MNTTAGRYDELPYAGFPRAFTHPDRLFTVAALFGMQPAPVEHARVLEIGCGDAANLIAMAYPMPRAAFCGIDLSERHIALGRSVAEALGLANLELRCQDLMDFEPPSAAFDYVIVHGLYSWSPESVRDRILLLCRRCLAPQGVALVSYNTFPAGHLRRMLREMMLFHARHAAGPHDRVARAREFLGVLAHGEGDSELYGVGLSKELTRLRQMPADALFHDDLSDIYEPVYFRDFIAHAARHRLQFLAESDLHEMQIPPAAAEAVRQWSQGDPVLAEQYLDFLVCRRFRATLLCRAEVPLDRHLKPSRLAGLYVASPLRPAAATDTFLGPKEQKVSLDLPLGKAALLELSHAFPAPVLFEQLVERAAESAPGYVTAPAAALGDLLLRLYSVGLVELYPTPARFTTAVAERPLASALARWQAARSDTVFTLRHHTVRLEDRYVRALLCLLDGCHDHAALAAEMSRLTAAPITVQSIHAKLEEVARLALLELHPHHLP